MVIFFEMLSQCTFPDANQTDLDAWNTLEGGSSLSTETELKVGIFGYDISCLAIRCIEGDISDVGGLCDMIEARGLDGLAFGV